MTDQILHTKPIKKLEYLLLKIYHDKSNIFLKKYRLKMIFYKKLFKITSHFKHFFKFYYPQKGIAPHNMIFLVFYRVSYYSFEDFM